MFAESNHADLVGKHNIDLCFGELGTSYCHYTATFRESTAARSEAAKPAKKQKEQLQSLEMSTKMKGLLKGLRYISQIFDHDEKEQEMQIGYPTDVKHVAHIGWDGPSVESPSWMNDFRPESEASPAPPANGVAKSNAKDLNQTGARDMPELPKPSRRQPFLGSPSASPSRNQPKPSRRQSTTGLSISSPSRDVTEVQSRTSRRSKTASIDSSLQELPVDPKKSRRRKPKESSGGGGSTRPARSKAPSPITYTAPFSDPGSGSNDDFNSDLCPKSPLKPLGSGEGKRGHGIS